MQEQKPPLQIVELEIITDNRVVDYHYYCLGSPAYKYFNGHIYGPMLEVAERPLSYWDKEEFPKIMGRYLFPKKITVHDMVDDVEYESVFVKNFDGEIECIKRNKKS